MEGIRFMVFNKTIQYWTAFAKLRPFILKYWNTENANNTANKAWNPESECNKYLAEILGRNMFDF